MAFDGRVEHFPTLAVDHFAVRRDRPPVRAYLLSHVHSDHLIGLARNFTGPLIYCTQATKELLLELQTRKHRLDYERGDIPARVYRYRSLRGQAHRYLRAIPLNAPTPIDECNAVVTAIDANHCPGSCMFLVQGDAHTVLYTGDIRAEPAMLSDLRRNPLLTQYLHGKAIDTLYLDNSSGVPDRELDEKSYGCAELVRAIAAYPPDTRFFMPMRTLGGVEELWVAAALALGQRIHVDTYTRKLFESVSAPGVYAYGPALADILTDDVSVRFHSCDAWECCAGRAVEGAEVYVKLVNSRYMRGRASARQIEVEREVEDGFAYTDEKGNLADDDEPSISLASFRIDEGTTLIGQIASREENLPPPADDDQSSAEETDDEAEPASSQVAVDDDTDSGDDITQLGPSCAKECPPSVETTAVKGEERIEDELFEYSAETEADAFSLPAERSADGALMDRERVQAALKVWCSIHRPSPAERRDPDEVVYPRTLVIPFARHSTLPELRRFVGLFPNVRRVVTIRGDDSAAFADLLSTARVTRTPENEQPGLDDSSQRSAKKVKREQPSPPPSEAKLERVLCESSQPSFTHEAALLETYAQLARTGRWDACDAVQRRTLGEDVSV